MLHGEAADISDLGQETLGNTPTVTGDSGEACGASLGHESPGALKSPQESTGVPRSTVRSLW